jgi:aryl-alcohol dehydrogenase-like predicted oxidoreductase
MHPDFLADQLAMSLDRLGLQTLDVCLLHNPEYFFSDAKHRANLQLSGDALVQAREEFYRRLQAAFVYLEKQIAAGRLLYYGVSSNTSTADPGDAEATSLSRMLTAARTAAQQAGAPTHHFAVMQCPMNLYEAGALLMPNNGPDQKRVLLDEAKGAQVAVLVNRPLNAMPNGRGGMVRLADLPIEPSLVSYDTQRQKLASLEEEYRRDLASHVPHSAEGLSPMEYFRWSNELDNVRPKVQSAEHWEQIESQMIAPHINQVLRVLNQQFAGDKSDAWHQWRERYLPELIALLREMRREATLKSREATAAITRTIDPFMSGTPRQATLSQKALWILTSTPGVTCVLNGMRTPAYVVDSLEVLRWPPLPDVRPVYDALQKTK